jgi:hypothetical protein
MKLILRLLSGLLLGSAPLELFLCLLTVAGLMQALDALVVRTSA